MNYACDIKFVYFVRNFYDKPSNTHFAICSCGNHDDPQKTKTQYVPRFHSYPVCILSTDKLCKFSVKYAISNIKIGISDDERPGMNGVILETYDGHTFESQIKYFRRQFYEQYFYYNENELICEKLKRGYLDELPTDIWNIIKKYIIS
jgi:hypothetical protein